MKVRYPYKCDYCLNQKGETNHWWLRPHDTELFTLLAWDEARAGDEGYEHICSESCAAKALSKWMTRKSALFTTKISIALRNGDVVKTL
jgi:hypothetical protein